jgi:hypothetical protein
MLPKSSPPPTLRHRHYRNRDGKHLHVLGDALAGHWTFVLFVQVRVADGYFHLARKM